MKRIVILLLGSFFLFNGLQDAFSGETIGFGTLAGGGRNISIDKNKIEFVLAIVFQLSLGIWFIKRGLFNNDLED
jgi:hypothetical protein